MKRALLLAFALLVLVPALPAQSAPADTTAEWTVMIYMAGGFNADINSAIAPDLEEMERAGYRSGFNILVLKDGDSYGDSQLMRLESSGFHSFNLSDANSTWTDEVDMSNPSTLRDFLSWGLSNYPAHHRMLVFWGHGMGWKGMPADEGGRTMTLPAASEALSNITSRYGKLDIIGFDQCNMAMFEVFYQIAPYANYSVASEKEEDISGWPYDLILSHLYSLPQDDSQDVCRMIVHQDVTWARNNSEYSSTMSALNLSALNETAMRLKQYSSVLDSLLPYYKLEISEARAGTESYDKVPYPYDLYDMTEEMDKKIDFPPLRYAGKSLREAVNESIVSESHYTKQMNVSRAHGISIWFPTYGSDTDYRALRANRTGWPGFLDRFLMSVPVSKPHLNTSVEEQDDDGDGANESFRVHASGNGTIHIVIYGHDGAMRFGKGNNESTVEFEAWNPGVYTVLAYSETNGSISNFTVSKGTIEKITTVSVKAVDALGNPVKCRILFVLPHDNISTDIRGSYTLRLKSPERIMPGDRIRILIEYDGMREGRYVWLNSSYVRTDFSFSTGNNMAGAYAVAALILISAVIGALILYDGDRKRKRMESLKSSVAIGKKKRIKKVIWMKSLVDREKELTELNTALGRARDGKGSTIFLTGEEGIGKRALAEKFRRDAGARALFYEEENKGEKRPYEAVIKLINMLRDMDLASLGESDIFSKETKEQAFEAVYQTFKDASRESPIIISIFNAQWLDDASIDFLGYIARGIEDTKIILIISAPQEELEDRDGEPHPLNAMLMSLIMEGKVRMLELERFGMEETRAMLFNILGKEIPPEALDKIYEITQGLPVMISEIGITLRKAGVNLEDTDSLDFSMPRTVGELVNRRLSKLEGEEKDLAEWAAVLGVRFSADDLRAMTGREDIDTILYRLIEDRILAKEGEFYKFDHPQLQKSLCDSMGEKSSAMHLKAAEYLEGRGASVYQLAYHFCMAGNNEKCREYSLKAAENAENSYAPREAIKHYMMAESSADDCDKARISLKLARNYRKIMEYEKAIGSARQAIELGCEKETSAGGYLILGNIYLDSAEWDNARKNYEKAAEYDITNISLDAHRGLGKIFWRTGRHEEAAENIRKSIELAEKIGDRRLAGSAMIDLANIYSDWGKYDEGEDIYLKAIKILEEEGDLSEISRAYNNLGEIYKYRGNLEKAIDTYMKCIEYAKRTSDIVHMGYGIENIGTVYASMGRLSEAKEYLSEAYRIFSKTDDKYMISGIYMAYGIIYKKQKNWEKSEENFLKSIELLKKINIKYDLGISYYEYAEMLKEKGDERAKNVFEMAMDIFTQIGSSEYIQKIEKEMEEAGW